MRRKKPNYLRILKTAIKWNCYISQASNMSELFLNTNGLKTKFKKLSLLRKFRVILKAFRVSVIQLKTIYKQTKENQYVCQEITKHN